MSRVLRSSIIGVAVVVMALATTAYAQPGSGGPGGPGRFGGPGGGPMGRIGMLLRLMANEQVQKELNLTDDQKTKLTQLGEKLRESFRSQMAGMENLSREERQAKFRENMEKMQKEAEAKVPEIMGQVAQILKPEQLIRAKQIQLQLEGAEALQRPEVAEAIGLSDEQKKKLESLAEEGRKKIGEMFEAGRSQGQQGQDGGRERFAGMREKMDKMRQEGQQQAMAVLTADQKTKLAEIMGKPVEIDRSQLFGPPGGRGRNGRGGRGGEQPKQ
jgi:Spy/CpxP family protein refolding chaperone